MDAIRSTRLTRSEMESRRLSAALDIQAGIKGTRLAKKWGVSRVTADRWRRDLWSGIGLKSRKSTGRPSRLGPKQFASIRAVYLEEIKNGKRWTNTVLQEFIWNRYRIRFHHDYCCRLLQKLRRGQL